MDLGLRSLLTGKQIYLLPSGRIRHSGLKEELWPEVQGLTPCWGLFCLVIWGRKKCGAECPMQEEVEKQTQGRHNWLERLKGYPKPIDNTLST